MLRFLNIRSNRQRDAMQTIQGAVRVENREFFDLTDGENPEFRYTKVS